MALVVLAAFVFRPQLSDAQTQPTFVATWGQPGQGFGEFVSPSGLATNAGDTLYVADSSLDRITLFSDSGQALAVWNFSGSGQGRFRQPVGLAIDRDGDVYVADNGNHRIQRFRRFGAFVEAFGDSGSGPGQFRSPLGITLTSDGQMYVADAGNARIQHLDWNHTPPVFVRSLDGGPQGFVEPTDVAVDDDGFVYVADFTGAQLIKMAANGNVVLRWTLAGDPGGEAPPPVGLALVGDALHVSDPLSGRIQVFDLNGNSLFVWPDSGIPAPTRLALSPTQRVLVTSFSSRVVLVYQFPVQVRASDWGDIKKLYRTRR